MRKPERDVDAVLRQLGIDQLLAGASSGAGTRSSLRSEGGKDHAEYRRAPSAGAAVLLVSAETGEGRCAACCDRGPAGGDADTLDLSIDASDGAGISTAAPKFRCSASSCTTDRR
jgi:hypothetical protein